MADKLRSGDRIPTLTLKLIDGSSLTLPDDLDSPKTLLLVYRGYW